MKAFACLVACLLFAVPAQAFGHGGGPHGGGMHPGGPHPGPGPHPGHGGRHVHGRGGYGLGFWADGAVPGFSVPDDSPGPIVVDAPSNFPPPGVIAATIAAASALAAASPPGPDRPAYAPLRRQPGPRIIYLGHRPASHGPQVIYGTD